MEKIAIFIDGSNLFYSAQYLNIEIDYIKLLQTITSTNRKSVRTYFYTGVDNTNERQQQWLQWMRTNGFRVVSKPLLECQDGKRKANLDVEITVDMISISDKVETIVIVAADDSISYAVSHLSQKSCKVEYIGLKTTVNNKLIYSIDKFTSLEDIKDLIGRSNMTKQMQPIDIQWRKPNTNNVKSNKLAWRRELEDDIDAEYRQIVENEKDDSE